MEFKLTETEIMAGADRYDLKALARWKMYSGDDGKVHLKVVPEQGKTEMYEVEPDITFKDIDGNELPHVDYFIITWRKGETSPTCYIRTGDYSGPAQFSMEQAESVKPKSKKRNKSGDDAEGETIYQWEKSNYQD